MRSPVRYPGAQLAIVAVLLLCAAAAARAQNVSQILAAYPRYSTFARLLSATGVINQVESRKSLTLLIPPNSVLDPMVASSGNLTLSEVGYVIMYHVLLQYLDVSELQHISNNSMLVTTLYQTTGRAAAEDGFVNVTDAANGAVLVGPPIAGVPMQAAILTNITQIPYNYSLYEINGVLIPVGLATAPPAPPPALIPAPAPVPSAAPVPVPAAATPTPSTSPVLAPAAASPTPNPSTAPSPITAAPTPTATPVPSAAPIVAPAASPPAPPNSGSTSTSPAEAPAATQSTPRPSAAPIFLRPTNTFALCGLLITLVLVL